MKKYIVIVVLVTVVLVSFALIQKNRRAERSKVVLVQASVQTEIDQLRKWYEGEWMPAIEQGHEQSIKHAFLKGRTHYKKIEWAVEYFFPQTAKELNGPPLAEVEVEEHIEIPPAGFQVIEEFLYPHYDTTQKTQLISESKKLASVCYRLQTLWKEHQFRDDQVWSALRLQIMRIMSLGISGFDTPLSMAGISEAEPSLLGVKEMVLIYKDQFSQVQQAAIAHNIDQAISFASAGRDFTSFDRMHFITEYLQPLAHELLQLQKALKIPVQTHGALNGNIASFLDSNAFNTSFFTPNALSQFSTEKADLGKQLFFSPLLSLNNNVSCASCHQPSKAFTDGLPKSRTADGRHFVHRNAPTLLYAGLQQSQFYDMRSTVLEDQVKNVIENKNEMHGSLAVAAQKLTKDTNYLRLFKKAFSSDADSVSEVQVQIVIATYIRSLTPFNSKFDRHLRGIKNMNRAEIEGFNLFMGKAKCGTCHFMPLFNGTVPPAYQFTESEVIGVPADQKFTTVDKDKGRYDIHPVPKFLNAFKTPTLRNVALTAPYMHNGVFATLEEVIDFYDQGGAAGRNMELENQTLPAEPLSLTAEEKRKLILFLHTLTDEQKR